MPPMFGRCICGIWGRACIWGICGRACIWGRCICGIWGRACIWGRAIGAAGLAIGAAGRAIGAAGLAMAGRAPPAGPPRPRCAPAAAPGIATTGATAITTTQAEASIRRIRVNLSMKPSLMKPLRARWQRIFENVAARTCRASSHHLHAYFAAGLAGAAAAGWGGFRAIMSSKSGSSPPATIRSMLRTTK